MKNFYLILISLFLYVCFSCKPEPKKTSLVTTSKSTIITCEKSPKIEIPEDTSRIKIILGTFLGNEKRNFYGNKAPSNLKVIWKFFLGNGVTRVGTKSYTWAGAGWTGQPLVFTEDSIPYIIQGAYDHHLRRINALTGKEIWKYKFDDVIKSTGSIWINHKATNYKEKYVLMQGSRQGCNKSFNELVIPSYRAVSLLTGCELWKLNSAKTDCYSRDVDGSSLVINDTAYIGLENGIFTIFNPDKSAAKQKDNMLQPYIYGEHTLYNAKDKIKHGGDLVTESSPVKLGNRIYITSGSGHIYGYNMVTKQIDWDFFTGSDINGSPNVTNDSCLIVALEKQYIEGCGGALKLDPSKPPSKAVVWFYPTENKKFAEWLGGIIGSTSINDFYNQNGTYPAMAAFMGIDGFLYVVEHTALKNQTLVTGFDNITKYQTPKLLFKYYVGPSISTPIFAENKLITCGYTGIHIFQFNEKGIFNLIAKTSTNSIEATPTVYNNRIYIASRDGFLYCYGDESIPKIKIENLTAIKTSSEIKIKQSNIPQKTGTATTIKEKFYLITGSFSIKSNAEKFAQQLTNKGYKTTIITPNKDRHLVTIGTFDSKEVATAKQAELKQKNIDVWILDH